jgi:hypothetical protein
MHQLDLFMEGRIEPMLDALTTYFQTEKLKKEGEAA